MRKESYEAVGGYRLTLMAENEQEEKLIKEIERIIEKINLKVLIDFKKILKK